MKLSFAIVVFSLLGYVIAVPVIQAVSLWWSIKVGEPDKARYYAERLHVDHPEYYAERARAMCSDRRIARARRLMSETHADYASAVRLLEHLEERCGATDRQADAAQLIEALATAHLARATALCRDRNYTAALSTFEQFLILPYPDQALDRAQGEIGWCRLAYARSLMDQELYDTSLSELYRAITSADWAVREAAEHQVPAVVRQELAYWVNRKQYPLAFRRLGQRQDMFGGYAEIASFFKEVAAEIEWQVFGTVLAYECRKTGAAQHPQKGQKSLTSAIKAMTLETSIGDAPMPSDREGADNLVIENDTSHVLQILLRGPEGHDVRLEAQTAQSLQVEAGEYIVGTYSPQNCDVRANRTAWSIKSAPYTYTYSFGLLANQAVTQYLHFPVVQALSPSDQKGGD